MKTFRIAFVAHGIVDIKARNQEEAERKFAEMDLEGPGVTFVEVNSDSVEDVTDAMSALSRGIKL